MEIWSRERVLAFAADRASLLAATALARTCTWLDPGTDSRALWGSCAGRGRRYQTVVALTSPPAYACNCPSRKMPCKHALALLLQWSDGLVPVGELPPFAATWLARQTARVSEPARAQRQPGELADPAAALKRAAARAERVAAGLDELDQWLCDQVRG
ncbi:MAG: SWIM zinc finger family protein, partial [Propionibacteriaceae bacterium]